MSLYVLKPGLLTTVQDGGRYGYQRYGVMAGGAMDHFALRVANLLVGNPDGAAALEITLQGPALRAEDDLLIAICGGDLAPTLDGQPMPEWQAVSVKKGSVLEFGYARHGCRAYLAMAGGVDVPDVLGSKSTFVRGKMGGFQGRALQAGDVLVCNRVVADRFTAAVRSRSVSWNIIPDYTHEPVIRVLRGNQFEAFDAESRERFFTETFRVTPQSDRMGYRLEGPALTLSEPLEMISEAVTFGTVQVPPGGQPIVLLADRQTTGGYPKLAQVAAVDLPVLAQLKPGDQMRFTEIALEEAQQLYLQRERDLHLLKCSLELR